MRYTGKVVGGLIGMFLGPLGAVAGVLLGHQVDEHLDRQDSQLPGPEELAAIGERFFRATFRVMGYLAKADGRVSEQEISAARTGVMLKEPEKEALVGSPLWWPVRSTQVMVAL